MKNKIVLGTVLASLLAAGAAFADPYPSPERGPQRPEQFERAREGRVTSLGQVVVGGRFGGRFGGRERNMIEVGRDAGAFTRLRLVVNHGEPNLRAVRVTFGNGESVVLAPSATIDLPGQARMVRSIELISAPGFRRDRAVIEVLGERAPMRRGFNRYG